MIYFDDIAMSDEELSDLMDEIGQALFARGKTPAAVEEHLKREVKRVCEELKDEEFYFTH